MKRKFKLIVPSFLTLIFCLLLIAGSTFAIFSSQDQASIEVTSGKVHVTATLTDLAAFSAEATDEAGDAGSATAFGVTSNYKYVDADKLDNNHFGFTTGGTAALENNVLTLDNIVPGDKVTLTLHIVNDSTVKIKYRVRVNVLESTNSANSLKLLEGLYVMVNGSRITNINNVNNWATTTNAGDPIDDLNIQVYLPIDAGNDYQDLSTELHFTLEAVQANAKTDDMLEAINNMLKSSSQVNKTMHDAVEELSGTYNIGVLSRYLWDSKSDLFFDESTVEGFDYQYFQVLPAMPAVQKYSIYAGEGWTATKAENLTVGFDAGNTTGITNVSYVRTGDNLVAREVLIRTNSASTAIEINAPKDVVHHYGLAGSLNIIAVAGQSYHEYGNVLFLQIATGRVALEETSKVQQIHLSTTTVNAGQANEDEVFDNIVIAKASSVEMPQFSRDPVSIPEEGKLVVALQDSTEEEADKDYVWLTAIGVYEQVTVSDSDTEAGEIYATQTSDAVQQKAAQEIANNITVQAGGDTYTVKAVMNNQNSWDYILVDENSQESTDYTVAEEPVVTVTSTIVEEVKTISTVVSVNVVDTNSQPVVTTDTIENGLSEEQKQQASTAECQHPAKYRTYVDVDGTNHKELCTFCGYYELHMHEYDAEDVSKCLKCKHTNQILVNNENAETTNLIEIMTGLNTAEQGTYTVELNNGIYLVPLNEMTVSQKNGVNIVFKAKNNAVKVNDKYNYNVILKPNFDKGTIVPRGNNDLFKVSGNSHYGFETLNINNIKFDLSEYTDKIICGDNPDNGRIFAVSCLPGTENRYAHNVTVENCDFIGNTGKRSSAVGANHNNSSPKGITISNCTGKDLNCWFNGYGNLIQISNCAGENMLCIANFQSDNTSNACFESTGVNVVIENVSGTYFAQRSKNGLSKLDGGTEHGVIYSIGGKYLIKNCNITTYEPNQATAGVFRPTKNTNVAYIEGCTFNNYDNNGKKVYDVRSTGTSTTINGVAVSGTYNLPAYAAKINTTYYTTFADALNEAVADDTIVLLSDISLTSANSLSKSITLDLNGNTITSTATLFNIYSNYNLTIKDTGSNGKITVYADRGIYSSGGGLVKIESGSLVVSGSNTYTYGVLITSGSNFEMTGGSITIPETSTSNYNYCVSNSGSGDIRISGGGVEVKELTASASGGNYAVASSGSGNIYISGGYITANTGYVSSYPYVFAPYAIYNTGSGTAYISGGYIQANGDLNWYIYGNLVEGKAEVTGGLFGGVNYYPVVSSQLAEGHRRFANPDATTSSDYQEVIAQYVILWLDGNGGVLTTDNTKTKAGTYKIKDITTTVSTNIFTRDGYSFMGWNTSADGTGTSYLAGDLIVMDSTITLYAQWVAIE